MLMAITKNKIINFEIKKGSFNGENFMDFVTDMIPKKYKKYHMLMDNARIHHYKKFTQKMDELGSKIIYNIPYSPEFNPIEYLFNTFKQKLSSNYIDTYQDLLMFINTFVLEINKVGLHEYFKKSYSNLFD